jgi:hypothetical protein
MIDLEKLSEKEKKEMTEWLNKCAVALSDHLGMDGAVRIGLKGTLPDDENYIDYDKLGANND